MGRKNGFRKIDLERVRLKRVRRITGGVVSHEHPVWSPDGKHLAFYAGLYGAIDIVITDRRGRFGAVIANGPGNKTQASWSPDGSKVAYRRQETTTAPWEIWEVDVLAGPPSAKRLLGDGKHSFKHPSYSPGGRQIAYFADEGSPGNFHLFVLDLDTGAHRQLTFDSQRNDCHPAWSPDGKELVFHAYEGKENASESNIYILDLDSGRTERVSPGGHLDKHPFFIDTRLIVFHRADANDDRGIYVLDRMTGRSKVLTDLEENCKHPHPLVTRKRTVRLAYASKEKGGELEGEDKRYDIFTARVDGLRLEKPRKAKKRESESDDDADSAKQAPPAAGKDAGGKSPPVN